MNEESKPERIISRIVECYVARPVEVAEAIDEHIDRSGNLLGWVRDAVAEHKTKRENLEQR